MTIVAGFCSINGVVLCADSEETGHAMKGPVRKVNLRMLSKGFIGFAAAGDAHMCEFLEQEIVEALQKTPFDVDERVEVIRKAAYAVFQDYIWPNPSPPYVSALVAVPSGVDVRPALLRIHDGAVTRHMDYVSIGVGQDVANAWARLLLPLGGAAAALETLEDAATFILWQVKQSVPGCGGRSDILLFRSEGSAGGGRSPTLTTMLERAFEGIQKAYGEFLVRAANPNTDIQREIQIFGRATVNAIEPALALKKEIASFPEMKKNG
jgi:hypothetical protein